jgi:hypothetical protein
VMTVVQGKAFLEFAEADAEDYFPDESPTLTLYAFFQGQRLCSTSVPCSCDPFFNHQVINASCTSSRNERLPRSVLVCLHTCACTPLCAHRDVRNL